MELDEESARAAREALEMMESAEEVNVVLIDPDVASTKNGEEPGADVATYLARHGIKVTVDRLPSAGRRVEEVLNQRAINSSADLLVMGAYASSRKSIRWCHQGGDRGTDSAGVDDALNIHCQIEEAPIYSAPSCLPSWGSSAGHVLNVDTVEYMRRSGCDALWRGLQSTRLPPIGPRLE